MLKDSEDLHKIGRFMGWLLLVPTSQGCCVGVNYVIKCKILRKVPGTE